MGLVSCLWTKKKFESYFGDRLTFSNIRSRTSRRIYRLVLSLRAPEMLSSQRFPYLKALCHYIVCAITKNRLDGPGFPYTLRAPRQYTLLGERSEPHTGVFNRDFGMSVYVCRVLKCVGGITYAHAQSLFWAVKTGL